MTIHFTSFPWALLTVYTVMCVGTGLLLAEHLLSKKGK